MRKTIWISAFLIISAMCLAVDEGDIVTQAQVDSIDFDTFPLQGRFDGYDILYMHYEPVEFDFKASVLGLRQLGNDYLVIRKTKHVYMSWGIWEYCRDTYGGATCKNDKVVPFLNYEFNQSMYAHRQYLKTYQTRDIGEEPGDIDVPL